MLYHVTRNGQSYGPYTLEDLQRYVASGNVLPTDLAKSEEMAAFVPVAQILGPPAPIAPPPVGPGAPGAAQPMYPASVSPWPDPPNLNWVLVLVLGIFTCGLFLIAWDIVQAVWMRKVNPRSNALLLYIAGDVLNFFGTIGRVALMAATAMHYPYFRFLGVPIGLITLVLVELARFDIRRSMEEHFNGLEPIGLALSGVMTFFFGSLYFQYHFSRINELKRMARYRGMVL